MGKRVKIALAVLSLALVGVIVWHLAQPSEPEPVYKGRTLTSWLKPDPRARTMMWRSSPGYYESDEAVIQIGTNAIPTLLRLLRARDSALKVKAIQLLQYQHVIAVEHIPARLWNEVAVWGFSALGTNAQRAVPALIEIAKGDISSSSRKCAIACLDSTGPAAKEAVPYLLQWATNADYEVRTYAKSALLKIAPEAAAKAEITSVP